MAWDIILFPLEYLFVLNLAPINVFIYPIAFIWGGVFINDQAYLNGSLPKGWWVAYCASILSFYIMGDPFNAPNGYDGIKTEIITILVWIG